MLILYALDHTNCGDTLALPCVCPVYAQLASLKPEPGPSVNYTRPASSIVTPQRGLTTSLQREDEPHL